MSLFRKKAKPRERRSWHRSVIPESVFEATLRTAQGQSIVVAVRELSAGGASVRPHAKKALAFNRLDQVVLTLVVGEPSRMLHIMAEVCRLDDGGIHLRFLEPLLEDVPLDAESRMLLSRRRFPRHRLQEHVVVDLTVNRVVVKGRMTDLSEGGLGMTLDEALAGRIKPGDEVAVAFTLPEALSACALRARVRHRTPHAGAILLGMEFVVERSDQLNAIQEFLGR